MAVKREYIDILVNIPGFSVHTVRTKRHGKDRILTVDLVRTTALYHCRCGREFTTYYDCRFRWVRDVSYGVFQRSYLSFPQVRVNCPACGVVTEQLDWIDARVDYTKRLAAVVALACEEIRSLKAIGQQFGLHEKTVKQIDKAALEARVPAPATACPTVLAVDEFAVRRRHRYATTVLDWFANKIPYIAKGRTTASLAGFYKALGPKKCRAIQAVIMDLWAPYEAATRAYCPNAAIVYDPFHIIAAYGRDVIDSVRRQEYRDAQREHKAALKGSRYLLLKNADNLNPDRNEPARLQELLQLNRRLETVYVLKDDLKQLWRSQRPAWVRQWFAQWYQRAMESNIKPLIVFADKLAKRLEGIVAHCHYPFHTGRLEGINNKIKVLKRIAYGFRDLDYFFLKIRGACN